MVGQNKPHVKRRFKHNKIKNKPRIFMGISRHMNIIILVFLIKL